MGRWVGGWVGNPFFHLPTHPLDGSGSVTPPSIHPPTHQPSLPLHQGLKRSGWVGGWVGKGGLSYR